jgi:DNA-binding CsgD family transcriptional regulator
MIQKTLPEYFSDNKQKLVSDDLRKAFLEDVAEKFELAHLTYFRLPTNLDDTQSPCLATTYPQEWQQHYFASGYGEIDPVLQAGKKGFLPFDWSDLCRREKPEKTFFGEAKEFGICDNGLTVPIYGANGEIALFSINSNLSKKEWDRYKHENASDIMYFGHLFHDVVTSDNQDDSSSSISLSNREKEVLFWAGKGKTCWETAKILGLTERTVDFYLRNASHKLGAATKTQAVANAIAGRHIIHSIDIL